MAADIRVLLQHLLHTVHRFRTTWAMVLFGSLPGFYLGLASLSLRFHLFSLTLQPLDKLRQFIKPGHLWRRGIRQ
ncbi:hypothetical protein D3C79_1036700 [compost metagenome]